MFTSFSPVLTWRALGWKVIMEKSHLPPAFKGSRILFLALGHFWFILFLLSSIASPSFTEVRLGDEVERQAWVAGVCEKAEDFFCPPKTALRDLLQRSIHGFGWESSRPWPWLSLPKRRTKCRVWQRHCQWEPVRGDNLFALLLCSCGLSFCRACHALIP